MKLGYEGGEREELGCREEEEEEEKKKGKKNENEKARKKREWWWEWLGMKVEIGQ